MKKLLALTSLFIAGKWLAPGAEVPGDVDGFDYDKAARKGMLEAEDGSQVSTSELTGPDEHFGRFFALQSEYNQLRNSWAGLNPEQVKADQAALAEYRETLGELLPASFPAQAKLFEHGYYTTDMLVGVEKATLTGISGIGDTTADQILKALPARPPEQEAQQPAPQG